MTYAVSDLHGCYDKCVTSFRIHFNMRNRMETGCSKAFR